MCLSTLSRAVRSLCLSLFCPLSPSPLDLLVCQRCLHVLALHKVPVAAPVCGCVCCYLVLSLCLSDECERENVSGLHPPLSLAPSFSPSLSVFCNVSAALMYSF